jgi:small-conductance mechanosensitive channel
MFRRHLMPSVVILSVLSVSWLCLAQDTRDSNDRSAALLQYLNRAASWYRQLDVQRQMATDPEEGLVVHENLDIANQVVSLAFDFARLQADAIEKDAASRAPASDEAGAARFLSLRRMLGTVEQNIRQNQAELQSLRQKAAAETGRQRELLQARIDETESEIQLAQARRESLRSMSEFVGGASAGGLGASGIREKIEALARSIPAAFVKPGAAQSTSKGVGDLVAPTPPVTALAKTPSGIWSLAVDVFALSSRTGALQEAIQATQALGEDVKQLRAPFVKTLRELSKRGDEMAASAETSDPIVLVQQKAIFDALTAQFKRTSDSLLPLSKQGILLDLYQKNLASWRGSLRTRYDAELRDLLIRVAVLLLLLGALAGGAELWRRAIFRYVRDARRRYQYLVLRKVVFWCVVGIVLVFSFANELGSIATFAGLITAGVAVALQSVILSIVAYFFLIGRYGIRVGDRVQVAGVTGEVLDVGLVRFHLIELPSSGEKTASGRVVAFSNSVVFQPTAGFFKQIPGTNFRWHEVAVTMPPTSDYLRAEDRLRAVVEGVFADYREEMEKQHRQMEKTLTATPTGALRPESRISPSASGLDVVIRYPVDLANAAGIDDRVMRGLLRAIGEEPSWTQAGAATPAIRLNTQIG